MNAKEKIIKAATTVRALLKIPSNDLCCPASVVLAEFLRKEGFNPKIIKGFFSVDFATGDLECFEEEQGGDARHYWIVCAGYLVDITADQFNDEIEGYEKMPPVLCVPLDNAPWRYLPGKSVKPTTSLLVATIRLLEQPSDSPALYAMLKTVEADDTEALAVLESLGIAVSVA